MHIYLAAPYAARDHIRSHATQLRTAGLTVTSTWLDEDHDITEGTTGPANDLDNETVANHAADDFLDIDAADTFILFTATALPHLPREQTTSGGRHVETGYFIATQSAHNLIVIGEPENVFHRATGVTVVPAWHQAFLEVVRRLAERLAAHETPLITNAPTTKAS